MEILGSAEFWNGPAWRELIPLPARMSGALDLLMSWRMLDGWLWDELVPASDLITGVGQLRQQYLPELLDGMSRSQPRCS